MVGFTNIIEIKYLVVSLFSMWCCPIPIYICGIKFFCLRYLSYFRHSDKSGYGFPKIIYHILLGAHRAELFSNKCFLQNQFYKLLWLWFYADFFLNLGFYYNAREYRNKCLNRQHISIRKNACFTVGYIQRRHPKSHHQ